MTALVFPSDMNIPYVIAISSFNSSRESMCRKNRLQHRISITLLQYILYMLTVQATQRALDAKEFPSNQGCVKCGLEAILGSPSSRGEEKCRIM
jgi:hypothetical protein